jgi:hypothetical protein
VLAVMMVSIVILGGYDSVGEVVFLIMALMKEPVKYL